MITIKTAIPGPKSQALNQQIVLCESPNVTYLSDDFPLFWQKAWGCYVQDVDENIFLDLNSAFGVCGLGHRPPAVQEALNEQSQLLLHGMGDVHPPAIKVRFLQELLSFLPDEYGGAILSCNGSDACESALKTAQLYTQKDEFIAFRGAYHGLGYGALSVTWRGHFRGRFQARLSQDKTHFLDFPEDQATADRILAELKKLLENRDIAALIAEPIQGRAGVRVAPTGFWQEVAAICYQNDALLIFDEIYTGLHRTGPAFAFMTEGIIPDLLCLGKLLGGGLPLSACVGRKEVMTAWPVSSGEAIHTSTFLGNPLACAAGLAVLRALKETDWQANNLNKEKLWRAELEKLPGIEEIRGRGLMLGLKLAQPIAAEVMQKALACGLIILPAGENNDVLSLSPPFIISTEELHLGGKLLRDVLCQMN